MNRCLVALLILIFWSCAPESKQEKSNAFYDIIGLIDEQIKLLDSIGPSVLKKAYIDGHEETIQFKSLDSAGWASELIVFKSIDINRSMLSDSYTITAPSDKSSIAYTSKYPKNTEVESLSIQFEKGTQKPIKVHALLNTQNELFNSAKTLEMDFKEIDGKMMLFRYKTQGQQQMISKDSTAYLIEAEIIFP